MFAAPEIELSASHQVTEKADIYSLGAILYVINAGSVMQRLDSKKKLLFDFSEPVWDQISFSIREFV